MDWVTVEDGFDDTRNCNDRLFQSLWREGRLRYGSRGFQPDTIDQVNARMVCAALEAGRNLLILQPDFLPHRAPILFSTVILRYWYDHKDESGHAGRANILYFGNTTGIRKHLACVEVCGGQRIKLSDVFQQQDLNKQNTTQRVDTDERPTSDELPQVRTVYSPADPVTFVEQYQPCLIAIDCSDAPSLPWLYTLLHHAQSRNIPTIAWGQNSFGEYVDSFCKRGSVFAWPPLPIGCISENLRSLSDTKQNFLELPPPEFEPLIIESKNILKTSSALRNASKILLDVARNNSGHLALDAIRIHWRYLRSLETLCVPVDFYEAEAGGFWGVSPLSSIHQTCRRFSETVRPSARSLSAELDHALSLLDEAAENMRDSQPIWQALCVIALEDTAPNEVHLIVFPTATQKRLFTYALFAYHNITEEEIRVDFRTWCVSLDTLKQLIQWVEMNLTEHPCPEIPIDASQRLTLVGIPSQLLTPRILPVMRYPRVEALLYPHQLSTLQTRTGNWSETISLESQANRSALEIIAPKHPVCKAPRNPKRIRITSPSTIEVETLAHRFPTLLRPINPAFTPLDDTEEITKILETQEVEPASGAPSSSAQCPDAFTASGSERHEWSDTAIELTAVEGFRVLFAPDDVVQLVTTSTSGGYIVDERYVRSLKVGDRIVVIHGQRRQNLYDLIISRVHQLPALQLHLALINRWQEDLRMAFRIWATRLPRGGAHPLEVLLVAIRDKGSKISCALSLYNWITGGVRCPQDPVDMRRVAEVLEMKFVLNNGRKIHEAGGRLSGIHRGLSRRLNYWLSNAAQGITDQDDETLIDDKLGLMFGDFRSSLQFLRLTGIKTVIGPFLRSELGMVER